MRGATLFVFEGSASAREALRLRLGERYSSVHVTGDVDVALELLARLEPDVAIVDLDLMERSGSAVCERLAELQTSTDVRVMGVGLQTPRIRRELASRISVARELLRPASPRKLIRLVEELLDPWERAGSVWGRDRQ